MAHRTRGVRDREVGECWDESATLAPPLLQGCYLRRGQSRGDGCATFWRKGRFAAVERRAIQYELMGLKDNAALVVVLRSVGGTCAHDLVVGNTHVLFNPKR